MTVTYGTTLPQREFKNEVEPIKEFVLGVESLGLGYLRVADQVIVPKRGGFHEPLMLLSYLAAITERLQVVPSVLVAPSRQTALLAKQSVELNDLSAGRLRLGLGLGGNEREYQAMGKPLSRRAYRLEEQIKVRRELWTRDHINFSLEEERFEEVGISPRPKGGAIPIWIGVSPEPPVQALERIGRLADGWFTMCRADQFESQNRVVLESAERSGRNASEIGVEAEVSIVDMVPDNFMTLVNRWVGLGVSHISLSTLGLEGDSSSHLKQLAKALKLLDK